MQMEFKYRLHRPIIDAAGDSRLQGNVNGPSLIRAPDWFGRPQGKYDPYCAHHVGVSIRTAVAGEQRITVDDLIFEQGYFEQSCFRRAGECRSPVVQNLNNTAIDG